MQITIPGRPQAKTRDKRGQLLDTAACYIEAVRAAVKQAAQRPLGDGLALDIRLVYTSPAPLGITAWPLHSIPNADTAPNLVLTALTGVLVHHRTQINPLTITRTVLRPHECRDLYGSGDGATILTWDT